MDAINKLKNSNQIITLPKTGENIKKTLLNQSDWCLIKAGVPQGSFLGPLLFLVFINDIVEEIDAFTRLFNDVDDTSLYIVVDHPLESGIKLNADLLKIDTWVYLWLVSSNPSKPGSLIFTRQVNAYMILYELSASYEDVTGFALNLSLYL